jgi:hypothetical protein
LNSKNGLFQSIIFYFFYFNHFFFYFLESIRGSRGVRIDENEIKLRIGRWLKAAPGKIGDDDSDED